MTHDALITGIGQSAVGRRMGRSGMDLTLDAVLAAIADAGLRREDIDGQASQPGKSPKMIGLAPVSIGELKNALALKLNWYGAGAEMSQL